jgi:hypothetical protein
MGWDRPLQGYFMVIESEADDEPVYSNLYDRALVQCGGLPRTLDHFLHRMDELGVAVPGRMLQQVRLDAAANAGNRLVAYDAEGNVLWER